MLWDQCEHTICSSYGIHNISAGCTSVGRDEFRTRHVVLGCYGEDLHVIIHTQVILGAILKCFGCGL